ncbi:MAG: topoisomerase DNA-binding C4 zinc finger domain-containing protein, partial [Candidatus Micrarchaeota archaeon]|nr:topoisomerase DNA-binding C4 zinc finger domain-containing protein [Candidatus Micrarchaeota archaeon]
EMEEIAAGNKKKEDVIGEGKEVLKKILGEIHDNEERIGLDLVSSIRTTEAAGNILGDCRECGGKLRMLRGRTGSKFVGCSNYPDCRATFPLPQKYGVAPTTKVCEKCKTPIVRVFWKGGKGFDMCLDPQCETKKNWGKKEKKKDEESPPKTESETKKKAETKKGIGS